MSTLTDTSSIIDALGGNTKVARLLGCSARRVSNWRRQDQFPARTYVVIQAALVSAGHDASNDLWAMDRPAVAVARERASLVAA